jgi:peptidoglycan/LPS O-acetylase OafA/YrhL
MQTPVARTGFRTDINGLRAWAVAVVMLYHFGVPGFNGGFVGVDIFFVISGFLMTGIVVKGLQKDSFSFMDFYLARARRILPALLVLCATLLALGWFLLMPPDFLMLGNHVIASLMFLSNLKYWDEAGYFDLASHEKWLLHTWSLSVEWQFYLILPLMLWGVWRLLPGKRMQIGCILAVLLISLAISVLLTNPLPSMAFFTLQTRAWEMLAGGLVFLLPLGQRWRIRYGVWLEALGFLMIVMAVAVFDKTTAWPGVYAMLPVLAAMMILWSQRCSFWTAGRMAQWLGERSYSLYLWHWPVCVALVYAQLQDQAFAIAVGICLTLLLGHLSYLWVENPCRKFLDSGNSLKNAGSLMLASLLVLLPATLVRSLAGVDGRFPAAIELAAAEGNNANPRRGECHAHQGRESVSCVYGGMNWRLIVAGDSHASAVVSAVALAQPLPDAGVVQWTYSGCAFVLGMTRIPNATGNNKNYQCTEFIDWAKSRMDVLPENISLLIVNRYPEFVDINGADGAQATPPIVYFSKKYATATPEFFKEFAEHIRLSSCELAKRRTVYLMRPIPDMGVDVPRMQSRRMAFGLDDDISISMQQYQEKNAWVWAAQDAAREQCGVHILDPLPYLCHDGRCYASKGGRPLYHDDNHLSEFGNKLLLPMFAEMFRTQ